MAKNPFGIIKSPVYEDYAETFGEFQRKDDNHRWRGDGPTIEFPHNAGSYEEQLDREEGRNIVGETWPIGGVIIVPKGKGKY